MDETGGEVERVFERKTVICLMMKDLGGAWTRLWVKEVVEMNWHWLMLIDWKY